MPKFNPQPKKGMPPKKAKKPLKRTPIKKKYVKGNNNNSKGYIGSISKSTKKQSKSSGGDKVTPQKTAIVRRKNSIKKRAKKTGEIDVFFELVKEHGDETIYCRCCNKPLYSISPINFSHILSKGAYPSYRLDKRNIWIVCEACHQDYEFGSRNQPKFSEKVKVGEMLKKEYYANNR